MEKYPGEPHHAQHEGLESVDNLCGQASQEPVPAITRASRGQILRLVRLRKNFDEVISGLPDAQRYRDEHQAVVRTVIRDGSQIEGRY